MSGKKRLLVTGASGFLGWHVCRTALNDYAVIGVYNSHPVSLPRVQPERCDLTDFRCVKDMFSRVRPDMVIHTAAESRPDRCEEDPDGSQKINVDASLAIAGLCGDRKIPCVFTSSDLVFDGASPPYGETSALSPVSRYGLQKAAAERGMLERNSATVICRMPLMYGDAPPPAKSFIQPLVAALCSGKELRLFVDEFRTPVSGTTAARGLRLAAEHAPGILHLGGKVRASRYEFGVKLAGALGRPSTLITPIRQREVVRRAHRPLDVSLDSSKAFALGYQPPSIEEELERLECVRAAGKNPSPL